jgi:hypothetical protein
VDATFLKGNRRRDVRRGDETGLKLETAAGLEVAKLEVLFG